MKLALRLATPTYCDRDENSLKIEFCTGTVTVNIARITAGKPAVTESQICKNPAVITVTTSRGGGPGVHP